MRELTAGVTRDRLVDAALAGSLTLLGVWLMLGNIMVGDAEVAKQVRDGGMYHPMSSHSWWMLPIFLAASVPVFWWRRSVIAVACLSLVVIVAHDVLFGWVTRCGAGLPLVFVLAFLAGRAYDRRRAWAALAVVVLLSVAMLTVDATTGPEPLAFALPVAVLVFAIARAVRHRALLGDQLAQRNEELRTLRDRRAALQVAEQGAQLSRELDALLQERLGQLKVAAESARDLEPAAARAALEAIETDSRRTLDEMRRIVGLLRGDQAELDPGPTLAHLDALVAGRRGTRLRVFGDPRSLPASVELSAYRIVEHLLSVLAAQPVVDVTVTFDDVALVVGVLGRVERKGDLRAALARARGRVALHGGRFETQVRRGNARVTAHLPVLG